MSEYMISKETCEAGISGVCPGCGGQITAIETVDNADRPTYWSGCAHCCRFTDGVPPETHQLARRLVEERTLVPYRMDAGNSDLEREYWLDTQTAAASRIVRRIQVLMDRAVNKDGES